MAKCLRMSAEELLGMAPAMVGLVVTMPLLGHATWCAYKDLIH